MSAPFIVFGLVFYLGVGILGRLMPQLQVFFVADAGEHLVGLILFALLLVDDDGLVPHALRGPARDAARGV